MNAVELSSRKCEACHSGMGKLSADQVAEYLRAVPGWEEKDGIITKTFAFKNYYETMAFVNAIAWIAHREDHHPDLEVHYNRCKVSYNTHAVGGLTDNDFICAAKVEQLANS